MKVLLIDVDSKIPNIALMKLSTYHKNNGDSIKLVVCNIPYYPNKTKKYFNVPEGFDIIYASVIFKGNINYIIGDNIIFGGSGFDLKIRLPEHIENLPCDYTIYPNNNISYGFITRGCIRNCSFCIVPEKEGYIRQVNKVSDVVKHNEVNFLDDNFLSFSGHKEILQELIDKKIKLRFCQGLDIRLIDEENSLMLSKLNYIGKYIFAFDDWKYKNIIEEKLKYLSWRKEDQLKFYVYVNPNMKIEDTVNRIEYLKKNNLLCYIMRDISCYKSENELFYTDIANYCNQAHLFKKLSFEEFLNKRHKNLSDIKYVRDLYYGNL